MSGPLLIDLDDPAIRRTVFSDAVLSQAAQSLLNQRIGIGKPALIPHELAGHWIIDGGSQYLAIVGPDIEHGRGKLEFLLEAIVPVDQPQIGIE